MRSLLQNWQIPWDDDVDICMKRKDYDRFFSEFNQQRRDTLKAISAETASEFKKVHNIENNFMILGVASAWAPRKGLDVFVKLAETLPDESFTPHQPLPGHPCSICRRLALCRLFTHMYLKERI